MAILNHLWMSSTLAPPLYCDSSPPTSVQKSTLCSSDFLTVRSAEVYGKGVAISETWIKILTLPLARPSGLHSHSHIMVYHEPLYSTAQDENGMPGRESLAGWSTPAALGADTLPHTLSQGKL